MKKRRKLIWQLYPSYLFIILISLGTVSWYASNLLESIYLDRVAADLHVRGKLMEKTILTSLISGEFSTMDRLIKEIGPSASTRITVILTDGKVVADSSENPNVMDNHADRPEVIEAATGKTGIAVRFSRTLQRKMMYVALPLLINDRLQGILRVSVPITGIDQALYFIQSKMVMMGFYFALIASVICYYISHRLSRPITYMKTGATQFAEGNLNHRIAPPNTFELAELSEAMNQMAVHLQERINMIRDQRNEYEAVLASMTEGVIAIDKENNILNINQAAIDIFKTDIETVKGTSIQELIRNQELQQFVEKAFQTLTTIEEEIALYHNGKHIFSIHASPLCSAENNRIGTLLVLNDITQLKRLESVRRDFVANASHEIKTPLTTIKGFVETLLSGALDNRDEAERFLKIVAKHANRLSSIIEDLMQLSRIESENELSRINPKPTPLKEVISTAVKLCNEMAESKSIAVNVSCEDNLIVHIDAQLFEDALVNLIDNAIKYSKEKSTISIEAETSSEQLIIRVCDEGIGISKEHLPRLFERFYRVDNARSRKLGGTGLGLSIVKHIVKAHEGEVSVESAIGKGSTFTIKLPSDIPSLNQKVIHP